MIDFEVVESFAPSCSSTAPPGSELVEPHFLADFNGEEFLVVDCIAALMIVYNFSVVRDGVLLITIKGVVRGQQSGREASDSTRCRAE